MSKPIDWDTEIFYRGRPLSDYRAAIIEECAKVVDKAENITPGRAGIALKHVAAAIRALKGK